MHYFPEVEWFRQVAWGPCRNGRLKSAPGDLLTAGLFTRESSVVGR